VFKRLKGGPTSSCEVGPLSRRNNCWYYTNCGLFNRSMTLTVSILVMAFINYMFQTRNLNLTKRNPVQ